ncbi:MAG: phage/plasmid primase, P4 family [Crocosphaera sp.]
MVAVFNESVSVLSEKHLNEWVLCSGVDPEIVYLNVRSLIGLATYDFLLYSDKLPRRNDGRLNNNTLKANVHLEDGGYGVNAIDPETGEDRMWGQLKPDNPKVTPDGKVRKYEVPPKEPVEVICPKVSHRIGLKVAKKAGLLKEYRERIREQWILTEGITYKEFLRQKDQLFWKWVKENVEIAIAVVEGTKKAGALLSQGIAAVSIPGIWNGCPKDSDGNPILLPKLKYFATPGREIVIVFDQDEKLKTQASVIAARERLASCFREACCRVTYLTWDTEEKGIDDAIVANGREWFRSVWENRSNEPAPIKVTKLEHELPKWNEKRVCEYLASLYKDILIYEGVTKEWYLYNAEKHGIWELISKERLEQRLMLELDALVDKAETITQQIQRAINAVKTSNRDKLEKSRIIEQLKQQLPKVSDYKFTFVEAIGKRLSRVLLVNEMATNSQKGLIPFRNGVLDLETRELSPHSPQNYLTWSLPYDYNPLAQCNPIKQWLLEMLEGDETLVNLIRAYLHGIVTGRADWQKFLALCGPGGSGKSTLTKLAIALVGAQNVHITDLDILEKDKFETANIKYKRLVIINEATSYKGVKKLKALTGGDRLRFEQKYKQALASFYPDALVIITSNEPIKTGDHTSGLYRREIPLAMNRRIAEKDQRKLIDHDRDNNITGEFAPYIPGLLNWVLDMDSDQATQIIKDPLNYAPGLLKSKLENLIDTNSIAAWLNEKVIHDDNYQTQVGCKPPLGESKEEIWLYASYCSYCHGAGINTISLTRFSYLLLDLCKNQLGFTVKKGRDRKGAFIQGLKIRDGMDADLPPLIEGIYTQSCDEPVVTVTEVVTSSVMGQRQAGDEGDGFDDFLNSYKKTSSSSVGLLEKPSIITEPIPEREKTANNPSNPSQSSPVKVTGDHEPVTDSSQEDEKVNIVSWDEIIEDIDQQMERLGWDRQFGQQYIHEKYGKKSRQVLSDRQLLEFLAHLKSQPKFKVGQTAIFRGTKVIIERLIDKFVAVVRLFDNPKEKPMEVSINHLSFSGLSG